jgi:hypothetical protein
VARTVAFHNTPVHSSSMNVAGCELAVLATRCLSRRLPDLTPVIGISRAEDDAIQAEATEADLSRDFTRPAQTSEESGPRLLKMAQPPEDA